ncbi:MAG: carboxypeptidase-like regulatory domain-containing protein [Lewinellaceae bacterium]|nr:carboxypeptidase-like regulatory domain-containing protein [Lewinellaceae bacterium]
MYHFYKPSCTLAFFILAPLFVFAQRYSISGTVQDANTKEALIGATISLENTLLGAISDINGAFYIADIPPAKRPCSRFPHRLHD